MFELEKELLANQEALLTIKVNEDEVAGAMQKAARHIARETHIPGFRKGKAPYRVVVQMFGEDAVRQQAAEDLLDVLYPKVLEQAELEPYASGKVENITLTPLVYTVRVPLIPSVDLGDYKSLRLDPEPIEITDEELAHVLEHVRLDHAITEPVARPAQLGDEVVLHVLNIEVDGETVIHDHDERVILDTAAPYLASGFVEALVGMSAKEEKMFYLTLPEDFDEEEFQGAEAEVTVEVAEVRSRVLPELDDALASTVGNFETLDELTADLQQRMLEYKQTNAHEAYRMQLLEAFVAGAAIAYPPIMEEEELDHVVERAKQNVTRRFKMEWADFLRLQRKSESDVREELRPQATKNLREMLAITELAKQMNVDVSEEEAHQALVDFLRSVGMPETEILGPKARDYVTLLQGMRMEIYERKALEQLERLAQGLPLETIEADEPAGAE